MERIATERPWASFYQAKAGIVAKQSASRQRMCGVETSCVYGRLARERGKACRDEPAAHIDEKLRSADCRCVIRLEVSCELVLLVACTKIQHAVTAGTSPFYAFLAEAHGPSSWGDFFHSPLRLIRRID